MKHVLQVLILAAACGACAAHAEEVQKATTIRINESADTLTAFNFPKITYGLGAGAARVEQKADETAKPGSDLNGKTRTALNFPKITFITRS
jgi:formylmethanofuran dehydrogenase subunit B